MPQYLIYNKSTGIFLYKMIRPLNDFPILNADQAYIEGDCDLNTQMYQDGKIVFKPEMQVILNKTSIAAITEYAILSNLPDECHVRISGGIKGFTHFVKDNELQFSIDCPGAYKIECKSPFTLDQNFVLEVI
jgi:hypothetical protein